MYVSLCHTLCRAFAIVFSATDVLTKSSPFCPPSKFCNCHSIVRNSRLVRDKALVSLWTRIWSPSCVFLGHFSPLFVLSVWIFVFDRREFDRVKIWRKGSANNTTMILFSFLALTFYQASDEALATELCMSHSCKRIYKQWATWLLYIYILYNHGCPYLRHHCSAFHNDRTRYLTVLFSLLSTGRFSLLKNIDFVCISPVSVPYSPQLPCNTS